MKSKQPQGRIKLLVLTSTFPRWEGDNEPAFIFELSSRLAENLDVTVLAPHAPGLKTEENWNGLVIRRFRYAPGPLETLAYQGGIQAQLRAHTWKYLLVPIFLLAEWWAARKLLRGGSYDLVHAHWLFPQGLIALLSGTLPLVVSIHGSDLHNLTGWFFRYIQRYVLGRAKVVTVVSATMADMARSLCGHINDLRVLPMGVELRAQFTPSRDEPREEGTFLFVGRLIESKGLAILLKAFALVLRQAAMTRLVIVGDGPDRGKFHALAHSLGILGQVKFIGALQSNQLPNWYRRATALVGPSRAEGLGMVFIEAAGCACPIIASDLPAVREIVQDGESGLLVPPGDPALLAATMRRVMADPELASRLGREARIRVFDRYDWTTSARGYEAEIGAALADR